MKPTIGRIVHFVQEKPAHYQPKEGPRVMVHLPAIIVAVWGDETGQQVGSWHWPERE